MVETLVALARRWRVAALELAGTGFAVACAASFDHRAGLGVVAVALLLKSFELDLRDNPPRTRR